MRHFKSKTYPYFIYPENSKVYLLAGIWEEWTDKETGEIRKTCSIITTAANGLMEQIHNTKKRMPLILDSANAREWLNSGLVKEEIKTLMNPLEASKMKAHTISRLVTSRTENSNVAEVIEKEVYEELPQLLS